MSPAQFAFATKIVTCRVTKSVLLRQLALHFDARRKPPSASFIRCHLAQFPLCVNDACAGGGKFLLRFSAKLTSVQEVVNSVERHSIETSQIAKMRRSLFTRACLPTFAETGACLLSALLFIVSFPDFNLWWLAWFALVPLLIVTARRPDAVRGFLLGWIAATIFFYGSCWWLTYSMINYGGIPPIIAYILLLPITILVGVFPALALALTARACALWGARALLVIAPLWTTFEWLRFVVTGQLWNAVGYSQAYQPSLIQAASWGGVYAVSFAVVAVNAAVALLILRARDEWKICLSVIIGVAVLLIASNIASKNFVTNEADDMRDENLSAVIIGVQPNISVDFTRPPAELARLTQEHFTAGHNALREWDLNAHTPAQKSVPRLVVFPESPMNFAYARDGNFRELVGDFARENRTAVLFNSQEPAGRNGFFNSAVLVDANGFYVTQYDKIQLLPFGEYIPVPRWMPGASMISAIVGDFTNGTKYSLLPIGTLPNVAMRTGVFICYESAFPSVARNMTRNGADLLINISNDGYFGATPLMRQHLANVVFRAVENHRPVIRVTNTGISARITERGEVINPTAGFTPAVQTWTINKTDAGKTFYTRYGDMFIALMLFISLLVFVKTIRLPRCAN